MADGSWLCMSHTYLPRHFCAMRFWQSHWKHLPCWQQLGVRHKILAVVLCTKDCVILSVSFPPSTLEHDFLKPFEQKII